MVPISPARVTLVRTPPRSVQYIIAQAKSAETVGTTWWPIFPDLVVTDHRIRADDLDDFRAL